RALARGGRGAEQAAPDVADTQPPHGLVVGVEDGDADHRPAGSYETVVGLPEELDDRLVRATLERPHRHLRGAGCFGAVSQTVDDGGDEPALTGRENEGAISGLDLARLNQLGDGPLYRRSDQRLHRLTVTVVPFPKSEVISKSSIRCRVPGSPGPSPPGGE